MRERLAYALHMLADRIHGLATRIRPQEDLGEGWWTLGETPLLTEYTGKVTFTDDGRIIHGQDHRLTNDFVVLPVQYVTDMDA